MNIEIAATRYSDQIRNKLGFYYCSHSLTRNREQVKKNQRLEHLANNQASLDNRNHKAGITDG